MIYGGPSTALMTGVLGLPDDKNQTYSGAWMHREVSGQVCMASTVKVWGLSLP